MTRVFSLSAQVEGLELAIERQKRLAAKQSVLPGPQGEEAYQTDRLAAALVRLTWLRDNAADVKEGLSLLRARRGLTVSGDSAAVTA